MRKVPCPLRTWTFTVSCLRGWCLAIPLRRTRISEGLRPFIFIIMKKVFTLIVLCVFSLCTIHAEITWNLSDDGTLTISGTDMPDYNYSSSTPWYSQQYRINKVIIENGVTSIGNNAFYYYSGLTSVTIPNSVTSIGEGAFEGCSGLTSITIPNSVTSIESNTFSYCTSLTSVTIPNSVTSIGNYAFNECSGLESIEIPNSVTSIGDRAFYGTKWYDTHPNGLVYAGAVLYYYKGTMPANTKIDIKEGTKCIYDRAFSGCSGLTSITIPNSVTSIGKGAFEGCSGLTSLTIGNSVTSIGDDAFEGCSGLTSLTIGNSVTSIGDDAFYGCSGLSSLNIPNSVTSIGERAFKGCSGLTSIIVEKGNKTYDSRNDCNAIIETQSNALIVGSNNAIIPNSVTSIGDYAFYGCSGLTSITIPNSVTSIGKEAFMDCSGLTSIIIPESVTNIEDDAFYDVKLRNIVIKAKTPPSGETGFSKPSYYHTTLMVPEGSWDAYAYDDNWCDFINIREMTYNAVNMTNSKAYMLKSSNEGSYLFYDSVNDCVAALNETALDDTEENVTWMTTEVDGKHYVYNLGAKKFLVADKTNSKTGYRLSDVPASIDIEDGKDAIVLGKSKEFYMVINDKLNVDEGLESQIIATTGIKGVSVEANKPTVTYNVNGQIVPNDTKGLHIKNGKKVIVK